ncbi:MAG: DUF3791 domain-containing protein [Bacteroidales bacterium]|nr:DUF3791 domain-containing protein [Bacteroidales bacterium]
MKQTTEVAVLPFKVLELTEIISEKRRLSFDDALFYLYNSNLYHDLINPNLKLWYFSGYQLYDYLEEEKFNSRKTRLIKSEVQFLVFCIEQYRLRNNLPSANVLTLFKELKLDKFLMNNFEVLHSQSSEYILNEIDLFIKKHK